MKKIAPQSHGVASNGDRKRQRFAEKERGGVNKRLLKQRKQMKMTDFAIRGWMAQDSKLIAGKAVHMLNDIVLRRKLYHVRRVEV
jgi:hypothetical protein